MRPRLLPCLLLAPALLSAGTPAAPSRPQLGPYRVEENWSFLRDPALRTEALDPLKFVPLGPAGSDLSLTLGGEARHRYEFYNNDLWGRVPDDENGYHLSRFMLFADLRHAESARAFVELKSGNLGGRRGPPRPPDEDILDLHQAFVELAAPLSTDTRALLRAGRQEFNYGSSRLVTFREGPNVRQSFDAVLVRLREGERKLDAFYGRPVETDPGVFDDQTLESQSLFGLYGVTPLRGLRGAHLDLYFLGYDRDNARFVSGAGEEERHSVGARFWGRRDSLDFNFEGVFQWGSFRDEDIVAWTLASDTGYTWHALATSPRTYLKANIISGDRDRNDDELNTFNALYPRGGYFGDIGLLGPANLINLHPGVQGRLTSRLGYQLSAVFYWREQTDDGIYNAGGGLQAGPGSTEERYIGSQADVVLTWTLPPYLAVELTYSRFWAGPFLEETGNSEDVDYISVLTRFRF